jgi:hypothetical protein
MKSGLTFFQTAGVIFQTVSLITNPKGPAFAHVFRKTNLLIQPNVFSDMPKYDQFST